MNKLTFVILIIIALVHNSYSYEILKNSADGGNNSKVQNQDNLSEDYLMFSLNILEDRIEGISNDFEGFILSMILPREFIEKGFNKDDLISLVRENNITGQLIYPKDIGSIYAGQTTAVSYEVVKHRDVEEIYMKSKLGYFLWEYVSLQDKKLSFYINWWYCPPASVVDLDILEMAKQLLKDYNNWDNTDDRKCDSDIQNNRWSLFCALKYASIKKSGEYNHHNTAIQTTRFVIDDLYPDHDYKHTLMDFNNAQTTNLEDILHVIDIAINRIEEDLIKSDISIE